MGSKNETWAVERAKTKSLYFRFMWLPVGKITKNYRIFLHLMKEDSKSLPVAQGDDVPRNENWAEIPTSGWQSGNIQEDLKIVHLPDNIGVGNFKIVVGFFHPETGERLKLKEGTGDEFVIGPIKIV